MPNHVTTVITARKEVLDKLMPATPRMDWLKNPVVADFNQLIPEPAEDDPVFTATVHHWAGGGVGYSDDGYSPLEWHREYWGTKWNAYNTERVSDTELRFQTAWNHPDQVIEALAEAFPDDQIEVRYADEDTGWNLGHYTVKNDEITDLVAFAAGSDEACEFASQLCYGTSYADMKAELEGSESDDEE